MGIENALNEASVQGLLTRMNKSGLKVGVPADIADVPTQGEREATPPMKIEPIPIQPIPTTETEPELQQAQMPGSTEGTQPGPPGGGAAAKSAADDNARVSKTGAGVKGGTDKKEEVSNKESDASGQKAPTDPTAVSETTWQSTDSLPEGTKHGDIMDTVRGVHIVSYQEDGYNDLIYSMKFVGTEYSVFIDWYEDVNHYGFTGAMELIKEGIESEIDAFKTARANGTTMFGVFGKDSKKPVPKDCKGVKLSAQETVDEY
tara:strand:+ start:247 stop:1026 length:780 start_codon:yes stop_codon:yes gene_type:complete